MKRRILGRTGLEVSELGYGGWAIGGNAVGNSYGSTDDTESRRAVRRAFELGCNFFDTADVYGHGHSEELIGATLHDVRDQVILATKVGGNFYNRAVHPLLRDRLSQMVGKSFDEVAADAVLPVAHDVNFTAPYVRFAVERSLQRLRTDRIDLLQLHNPPINLITEMDTYAVLEDLKREGLIRFYGVSVHPPEEGLAAILAAAQAAGVGVIAREPLANGFLTGKYAPDSVWEKGDIRGRMPRPYVAQLTALGQRVKELASKSGLTAAQLALRFVLDNTAVSTVIVGMKSVSQVEDNLAVET